MKWITRERPKIDRIACPWLITRFIDKKPEFIYAPPDKVVEIDVHRARKHVRDQGAPVFDRPHLDAINLGPFTRNPFHDTLPVGLTDIMTDMMPDSANGVRRF